MLRENGHVSKKVVAKLSYADGEVRDQEVLKTTAKVIIANREITLEFTVLPNVENNTLLEVDFLEKANIVLDFPNKSWYFADEPSILFKFVGNVNKSRDLQVYALDEQLRTDEGNHLTEVQRRSFSQLLNKNSEGFKLGGEPTSFADHHIKTEEHDPISVPPYPLSKVTKEFLEEELDRLLAEGIVEECESP